MSAPHTHINYKLFSELLTAAEKECVIALWCYQYSEFRYNVRILPSHCRHTRLTVSKGRLEVDCSSHPCAR